MRDRVVRHFPRMALPCLLAAGLAASCLAQAPPDGRPSDLLTDARKAALDTIQADSLKGHLSFLASDLLEGRDTPSRGLDLAAEYIASQFRRAGLEPAGDDGFFQTARWKVVGPDPATFRFEVQVGEKSFQVPVDRVDLAWNDRLELSDLPLVKLDAARLKDADGAPTDVAGKAVFVELPSMAGVAPEKRSEVFRSRREALGAIGKLKPALIVDLDPSTTQGDGVPRGRLIDPESPGGGFGRIRLGQESTPAITVHDRELIEAIQAGPVGKVDGKLTLTLGGPVERPAAVRNVVGLLRGSDPALKDSYVIVSAHYDHVGIGAGKDGDRIYNGANDDGSGTVAVVELASALAKLEPRPKRSILFLTFFGEEKGLLGSRYFGRHPVVPLEKIVAHVNLEQVGRTDDTEGPQVNRASLTGFDFSEVGTFLQEAGKATGVEVFKHPRNSDAFFGRSDNQALADLGIPAHTLCVAFIYPDYHGPADHWEKVDFANMARVTRTIGLGLALIADRAEPPKWNADNAKAARYLRAWEKLHAEPRAVEEARPSP
jgi:hypothetical protein